MCVSPQLVKNAEHLASETPALAFKIWSPAPVISDSRGRKLKRAKYSRFRSHQWRAFTAGVLHSVQVYPRQRTRLKQHPVL